ncbi:MAG: glycosyltransferase family 4 protein [Nanoarchaeota archaeon]
MSWNFYSAALDFAPDIIIAHGFRHLHTVKALKIKEKLNCKVFLVTHAPFIENNSTRSFLSKLVVSFYDKAMAKAHLNKFDKIIHITHWEVPYLLELGAEKEKLVYIPNGIPDKFFEIPCQRGSGILFLGRVSQIKNLEVLIRGVKNTPYTLDIVGPAEEKYKQELLNLIKKEDIKNVGFFPPVFNIKEKISLIDKHEIFVLPSWREAMPQSLIEAMSRKKIIISSETQGGREIISNGKDGLLFPINNEPALSALLKRISKMPENEKKALRDRARSSSEQYRWSVLIKKLEGIIE